MAGTSLLMLLDDIASVLDDVAVMSKLAAKKTAGVLGDDLALNAQQVTGVKADRELPVVWAVAVGSLRNKLILVPAALLISAFAPWAILPLLMLGGAFLCFEGFEKLAHKFLHRDDADASQTARRQALQDPAVDMASFERDKIKGAVRTDFILSAEIIVIALGTISGQPFGMQVAVLSTIGILMTVGVYGLVAAIVKLDDAGLLLQRRDSLLLQGMGRGLLWFAPWLMKALSVLGTAAMFLVGGGILVHGAPFLHHAADTITAQTGLIAALGPTLFNLLVGLLAGALCLLLVSGVKRLRPPAT
jgi:uncharacterized protein